MAKKRLYDEEGNVVKGAKLKKPFYQRWWFIALVVIIVIGMFTGGDEEADTVAEPDEVELVDEVEAEDTGEVDEEPVEETSEEPDVVEEPEPDPEIEEVEVPREHRNALRAAENYISFMPFSEKGLFQQLTSEYGDGYPEEAAQYAIDNIEVDYSAQALKSAENYLNLMPMSDSELFDQLTSQHGDGFTSDQAQFAIDNLD